MLSSQQLSSATAACAALGQKSEALRQSYDYDIAIWNATIYRLARWATIWTLFFVVLWNGTREAKKLTQPIIKNNFRLCLAANYTQKDRYLHGLTILSLVQVDTAKQCVDQPGMTAGNRMMHQWQNTTYTEAAHIITMSVRVPQWWTNVAAVKYQWYMNAMKNTHLSL